MQELDDNALLREYAERDSHDAFATLVARHVNKVYSVALRHTRNPHSAEEITQAVFVIFARKAGQLHRHAALSGWLYETARLTTVTFIRSEIRRTHREQEAHMQTLPNENEADVWRQIAPLLDAAMAGLNETDRHAIVLRFFDGKSMKETGAALGASEDAAKMRVNRAIEKLQKYFHRHGVTSTAATIAGAISANSVQAAPAGLAATISTAVFSGTAATTATIIATTKTIAMTTLQKIAVTAALTATIGAGIYAFKHANDAQSEVGTLQRQQAMMAGQIQNLQTERDELAQKLSAMNNSQAQARRRREHLELLGLRGRVNSLINQLERAKMNATTSSATAENNLSTNADSIIFSSDSTNRVADGQTLVVGGWSKNGLRNYLLIAPKLITDNLNAGNSFVFSTSYISAPESFWQEIGWSDVKSSVRLSSIACILSADQAALLIAAVKSITGGEVINGSPTKAIDGEKVGLAMSRSEDNGDFGVIMGVDMISHLSSDGLAVDIELKRHEPDSKMPVHPSLK